MLDIYEPEFKLAGKPEIECSIRLNDRGGDNWPIDSYVVLMTDYGGDDDNDWISTMGMLVLLIIGIALALKIIINNHW